MKQDEKLAAESLMYEVVRFRTLHIKSRPVEGIKPSEMFLLMHVAHWEKKSDGLGAKVSELSDHLRVKMPTVTQSINNLERMGIVERKPDQEDRRLVRILLTEKGKEITHKSEENFAQTIRGLVEYLGAEESLRLAEVLRRVFAYFEMQGKSESEKRA